LLSLSDGRLLRLSIRVERIDMRAGALVAAAAADDELIIDQKRCRGQRAVRFFGVVELDCPDEFAGIGLGPQDLAIGRDKNDEVLVQRDPAVRGDHEIGLVGARIHDPDYPGLGWVPDIYSVDCAEAVDDVHGTVVDEGRALVAAQWDFAHTLRAAQRDRESDMQILNIILIYLVELGITVALARLGLNFPPIKGGGSSTTPSFIKSNIPYNRVDVARGQDCRQFHFYVRNKSISFKEFLLLIFDFYSTSCAIIC